MRAGLFLLFIMLKPNFLVLISPRIEELFSVHSLLEYYIIVRLTLFGLIFPLRLLTVDYGERVL